MNVERNVRLLYVIRFFHCFVPAYVIERLFWEQRGMTIPMVVYTEIIYAVTIVLLEIPTGIIADKWGRKRMILLDAALSCCEFLILAFASKFWHFGVVVFLAGIGHSASSGAENALLYDTLQLQGKQSSFEKIVGRMNMFDIFGALTAALCGSFLAARFDLVLNNWISFASLAVSLGFAWLLIEPVGSSESDDHHKMLAMKDYVASSLRFFSKHPAVCLILISGMVTGASLTLLDEFWQLYMAQLDVPIVYFGVFSASFTLIRLPGSLLAYWIKSKFDYRPLLLVVIGSFVAGFALISWSGGVPGVIAMFVVGLFSGIVEPLASGYLHHRINSSMRATIDSFQSLGQYAMLTLTGLGFGYFSSRFDIFGGFGFIAVLCACFWIVFYWSSRKA